MSESTDPQPDQPSRPTGEDVLEAALRGGLGGQDSEPDYAHTFIVAICVVGPGSRADSERWLHDHLPRTQSNLIHPDAYPTFVDSWWIAEDERHDGSDNDSAVFLAEPWRRDGMTQEIADDLLSLCDRLARSVGYEHVVNHLRQAVNQIEASKANPDTQEDS